VNENNKMAMNPTNIIRADDRRFCSFAVRALGEADGPFAGCADVADFPIRPLSIVKAALLLHADGPTLVVDTLAYLSVSRALDALNAIVRGDETQWWERVLEPFLRYELALWGSEGRPLLNFGVLGFALFLAKNKPRFVDKKGKLVIKTTWTHVSEKRGSREYESTDRSDFAKLAALKERWEKPGDLLRIEASRDPYAVAREINAHFWKNRPQAQRVWRPQM
jgi:hypothetical protein